MQNQELKVYLSSLIQTIEDKNKLELIKDYVENLALLEEFNEITPTEDLKSEINYSFKLQ